MAANDNRRTDAARPEIRLCAEQDGPEILRVINAAAVAYRDVISADRWHDPYMLIGELRAEMAAGVHFTGFYRDDGLIGVMGIQQVKNVRLIRHAYVLPQRQGQGIGARLIEYLRGAGNGQILVGTWAAANWAIRFYERHGFELVSRAAIAPLLRTYWNVPERQIETSVVLSIPALSARDAMQMITASTIFLNK